MYGNGHTLKTGSCFVALVCRTVVSRAIKASESVEGAREKSNKTGSAKSDEKKGCKETAEDACLCCVSVLGRKLSQGIKAPNPFLRKQNTKSEKKLLRKTKRMMIFTITT